MPSKFNDAKPINWQHIVGRSVWASSTDSFALVPSHFGSHDYIVSICYKSRWLFYLEECEVNNWHRQNASEGQRANFGPPQGCHSGVSSSGEIVFGAFFCDGVFLRSVSEVCWRLRFLWLFVVDWRQMIIKSHLAYPIHLTQLRSNDWSHTSQDHPLSKGSFCHRYSRHSRDGTWISLKYGLLCASGIVIWRSYLPFSGRVFKTIQECILRGQWIRLSISANISEILWDNSTGQRFPVEHLGRCPRCAKDFSGEHGRLDRPTTSFQAGKFHLFFFRHVAPGLSQRSTTMIIPF